MTLNNFILQSVKSVILLGIVAWLCYILPQLDSLNAVFAVTLFLSLLVWAVNSYWRIIGITVKSLTFKGGTWIMWILARRSMAYIVISILAFASSLCFVVHVPSLNPIGFGFILLTAPVFAIVYCCFRKMFEGQSVDWMITGRTLCCSIWVTPVLMVLLYGLFLHYSGWLPVYETLDAAIEAQPKPWEGANSELLQTIGGWSILWGACRDFGFGQLFQINEYLSILLVSLGYFALFFNVCSLLACFYIPLREYKRLLLPLTPSLEHPKVSPKHVFALCPALVVFVSLCSTLFYWQEQIEKIVPDPEHGKVALATIGEIWVKEDALSLIEDLDKKLRVEFEPILAGHLGKLEGLQETLTQFQQDKEELLNSLAGLKNNTYTELKKLHEEELFPLIERNVDNYLNWYYSIPGEYARLGNLIRNNFEQYMKDKLNEHLLKNVDIRKSQERFRRFVTELDKITAQIVQIERQSKRTLEQVAEVSEEFARIKEEFLIRRNQEVEKIVEENRVDPPEDMSDVSIVAQYDSMDDFMESFQGISVELASIKENIEVYLNEMQALIKIVAHHSEELLSFKTRSNLKWVTVPVGVGVGLKVASKPMFRAAAEVVVKQIIKRSTGVGGGAAGGAVVGAGVGSIVPVIGTGAGAVVGGIAGGVGAWFATDYALIKLEDYISRASFKREIIYGINEQKAEVIKALDDIFGVNQPYRPAP